MIRYRASDGAMLAMDSMVHSHLVSAHRKLVATEPGRKAEIDAMAEQIARNDAEFARQIDALRAARYSVHNDYGKWIAALNRQVLPVPSTVTENAMWAKVIKFAAQRAE